MNYYVTVETVLFVEERNKSERHKENTCDNNQSKSDSNLGRVITDCYRGEGTGLT